MAVVTGMQEITSGERASEGFDFKGGRCGYMVADAPQHHSQLGFRVSSAGCNLLAEIWEELLTKWIVQRLMIRQVSLPAGSLSSPL